MGSKNVRLTQGQFEKKIAKIRPNYTVLGSYVNMHTPVKVKCSQHNLNFKIIPVDIIHQKSETCPKCKTEKKIYNRLYNLSSIKSKIRDIFPNIEIYSYNGMNEFSNGYCKLHKKKLTFIPSFLIHRGLTPCIKCKADAHNDRVLKKRKNNFKTFQNHLKRVHPNYIVEECDFINTATPCKAYCSIHEDSFTMTNPDTSIRQGCRSCPKCLLDTSQYSLASLEWIKYMSKQLNFRYKSIQTAENGGEFYIQGIGKVDGYHARSNTVFEFHGDVYHGNLKVFKPHDRPHPFNNKTAKHLYAKTKIREKEIRKAGYNLITIWESDWLKKKGKISK